MGKLVTYTLVMSGMVLLFYLAGLIPADLTEGNLLFLLLNMQDGENSGIGVKVGVALLAAGSVGVVVGFFTRDQRYIISALFGAYIFNLLWGFLAVFSKVYSEAPLFALIIFGPLLIVYCVTIVEWVLGQDN